MNLRAQERGLVVYVACGFYSGERGEQGAMNVRGWVVSGTVRLVPTEVSPLDRHF
jgi:hypothetical protein